MFEVLRSEERGRADWEWLHSAHSFSFGSYFNPKRMGFRSLRVINEDTVAPGAGFPTHGHRDMEILSYVLSGELEHKDSMNNGALVRPGEIQYMRAGTGVRHSEYNASQEHPLRFLQIWIIPNRQGGAPAYDQRTIDEGQRRNRFSLLASGDPQSGAIAIQQDARVLTARFDTGTELSYPLAPGRGAWVQVIQGQLLLNEVALADGDGMQLEQLDELRFQARTPSEVLLFDLGN